MTYLHQLKHHKRKVTDVIWIAIEQAYTSTTKVTYKVE